MKEGKDPYYFDNIIMKQGDVTMDDVATTTSSITAMSAVSCGCNPRISGTNGRHRRRRRRFKLRKNTYHEAVQFDAVEEGDEDYDESSSEDGFFYFDAEEDELGDSYYPLICGEQDENYLNKTRAAVVIEEPSSPTDGPMNYDALDHSSRYHSIVKAPIQEIMRQLRSPRVLLGEGYPGGLTEEQLEECRKFLVGLKEVPDGVVEQIYSFRDVEEPAYTICRWVRATKWDAAAILKRCVENQPMFEAAKQHQFFPDPSKAMGAPFPVFLSQYPFLAIGRAKNGCCVNYFVAGKINPEGINCLASVEDLEGYFWWSFMHKMKAEIRASQEADPNFVRCEGINIIDLQGLSRSSLSSETFAVIKLASKVADFFPEVSTVQNSTDNRQKQRSVTTLFGKTRRVD
jgi:hypothetical protein